MLLSNALEITSYSQGQNPDDLTGFWTMRIGRYFLAVTRLHSLKNSYMGFRICNFKFAIDTRVTGIIQCCR